VNSGGAVGTVFRPVGFWDEHAAADRAAFQILIPVNLRFQRPHKGQDRPAEPLAADRERNHLRAGVGVPVVKGDTGLVFTVAALPPDKGVCLLPLRRVHAVQGTVRPVYPKGGKSTPKTLYFHALGIMVEWKKRNDKSEVVGEKHGFH